MAPVFLTLSEVFEIHRDQIERYGGHPGIRDAGLLRSAVAVSQATMGGEYLHADLFEMPAAYLFHIVKNHPFADGNKRTGAVAALVFLELNGIEVTPNEDELVGIVLLNHVRSARRYVCAVVAEALVLEPAEELAHSLGVQGLRLLPLRPLQEPGNLLPVERHGFRGAAEVVLARGQELLELEGGASDGQHGDSDSGGGECSCQGGRSVRVPWTRFQVADG